MQFYEKAFGAKERHRWSNDDGSVHVAEMELDGATFHLHEEVKRTGESAPETLKGVTSLIGVFVNDPHSFVDKAVKAGAKVINPVTDHDYGYRQATIADPFGHLRLIQRKI